MLLREAMRLASDAKLSQRRKACLACSFEPLHLKTYLQAHLALSRPDDAPALVSFGYDQLEEALARSETELAKSPAFVVLAWEDLHPGLSWRSRGALGPIAAAELASMGERLEARLERWLLSRPGAQSCLLAPPPAWLPPLDPQPPEALGPTALAALEAMARVARRFAAAGGRVLKAPEIPLNYRDLLLGGFPLSPDGADAVARLLVESCFSGRSRRKVLVVDLDETLWAGTIGEDGPDALACGAQGRGFAYNVFQKFLLKLKAEGVLLAFCSKNNPDDVLPHFDSLNMPLKLADFAATRCGWEAKSDSLRSLAAELNVGTDSLVAVDDSEVELAELRSSLPEVVALKTPADGRGWLELFSALQGLFGAWRVAEEDKLRAAPSPRPRSAAGQAATYLRDMGLDLAINREAFKDPRSLELINKTNQFNLTGERLSPEDWLHWSSERDAFCLSVRLKDRFGDFGTVCVVAGKAEGSAAFVRQFVLSCRAFGRCVEALVLGELARLFPGGLRGAFKRTLKNEPARLFLASLGCGVSEDGEWTLSSAAASRRSAQALAVSGAKVRA